MSKNSIKDTYFSEEGKAAFYEIVNTNLFVGMELANYDSLCRVLNISKIPPFGNTRIRHNTAWSCFFEFHRVENTNRIRIDKIYPFDQIREYECPTSNGKTKDESTRKRMYYADYIYPLLQDFCEVRCRGFRTISFTVADILEYMGFVNKKYIELNSSLQNMYMKRQYNSIDLTIHKCIQSCCYFKIFMDQINKFIKKGIISECSFRYFIKDKDNIVRMADKTETELIRDTITKYQNDENSKIHWNSSINNRHISYLVNEELKNNKEGFTIKGSKWVITFTDDFKSEKLSDLQRHEYREKLNELSTKRVISKVEQECTYIYNRMNDYETEKERERKMAYYIPQYHMIGSLDNFKASMTKRTMSYLSLEVNIEEGPTTWDDYEFVVSYYNDEM